MALPEFPTKDDLLNLSDERLGARLLVVWIATEAETLRIDPNAPGFADTVRANLLAKEALSHETAAVEKALHKAACGDFEAAGKLLRGYMYAGAEALKFIPIGKSKFTQAVKFRRKGAEGNKAEGEANRKVVLDAEKEILASWKSKRKPSDRQLARLIERKPAFPPTQCAGT